MRRLRLPQHLRDDAGFTVVEMGVVLLISSVVAATAFAYLHRLMGGEARQQATIANQEDVRFAVAQLTRDIRNANPVLPLGSFAEHEHALEVRLGPAASAQSRVRWELAGSTLVRSIVDAGGRVVSSRPYLDGVERPAPIFRYFDGTGVEITAATTSTVSDVAGCAVRVRVSLAAIPDARGARFEQLVDENIRNRSTGVTPCSST